MSQKPCPICGSDKAVEPDDQEYRLCSHCGTLRTVHNYDENLYNESYAKNYIKYADTRVNTPLQLSRLGLVSRWLKVNERILDIGCCIGVFLSFAEEYYSCEGFEPNIRAVMKKRCEATVYTTLNGSLHEAHCVTMFDVLEHIQQPKYFLTLLHNKHLKSGGILAITTPNVEAVHPLNDENLRKWKHYKPKEHLFLYSERGLETLLQSVGFSILHWGREESDIRPDNPNGDIMTCVARKV